MKKFLFLFFLSLAIFFIFGNQTFIYAQEYTIQTTPILCPLGDCPTDLKSVMNCTADYNTFLSDPIKNHFWAFDPEITAQGKTNERARQFIYWVFNRGAVDEHPVLKEIWGFSANIVFFLIVLVVGILGIGLIIGQRSDFDFKIKVWPIFIKIGLLLLYTAFSATIVFTLINISELLMKFFIEGRGGKELFNIYFSGESVENNYTEFIGCRDLNLTVQESAQTEIFLLKLTNITYYLMGGMIILRKVILWFMLFVLPFVAILAPFNFIRNVGWIWIGVFFQWLFYGPLFALFLGALVRIWSAGIPFVFFFGRVNKEIGYIYPTVLNIVYGGPSQIAEKAIGAFNNANYIDTFAEYVIALIMLWTVIFLPWWLLRIFRDYCCDGIYATKNILMSMYDQMRGQSQPPPTGPTQPSKINVAMNLPQQLEIPVKVKLETIQEIKRAKTEEIVRSIIVSEQTETKKLTNIAQFETNKQVQETVKKNIEYLANPMKAETPNERQKFMNIRNELYNRAIKQDRVASNILSTISQSRVEQLQKKQEVIRSLPKSVPISYVVSIKVKAPEEQVKNTTNNFIQKTITDETKINNISQKTGVNQQQTQKVLQVFKANLDHSIVDITNEVSKQTGIEKQKVSYVLREFSKELKTDPTLSPQEKEVAKQLETISEPEKTIEEVVPVPPTVAIEDYENVKKMWKKQYQEGEVPITENIKSRKEWVEKDIVFITNTLNKLMSSDPNLKQQGLDDLSYILPVFMLNNLKGEEILVYLKAKLEAAKTVVELLEKESEITEKLKQKADEELVEVERPKQKEAAKTMELKQELKLPEDKGLTEKAKTNENNNQQDQKPIN